MLWQRHSTLPKNFTGSYVRARQQAHMDFYTGTSSGIPLLEADFLGISAHALLRKGKEMKAE